MPIYQDIYGSVVDGEFRSFTTTCGVGVGLDGATQAE